ncbi:MAG: hypothetical protein AAFX09_07295 [Pseudomonadota bacterium]
MVRIVILTITALAVVALLRIAFVVTPASGALRALEPTGLAGCRTLEIASGTEDVAIDEATGRVFVSTSERRSGAADPDNGIYAFELSDPEGALRRVSIDAPADFRPHGISFWRGSGPDGDPRARLFVISHPSTGSVVLAYDVAEDGALTHTETISYEALRSPNDLVAVGPDAFYASNDIYFGDTLMGRVEAFLGLPLASVSYWDGASGRIAAGGLIYGNGIEVSEDGTELYAASLLGRSVHVFARDAASGALTRTGKLHAPLGVDNIERGPDGALYIGGHPQIFTFLDHQRDPDVHAPSEVMRLDPQTGEWSIVFASTGEEIDASSVGAVHDGQLIVGAVFDSHILLCPYSG